MKTCFIYQADIFCSDCGNAIINRLEATGAIETDDSDDFPQEETLSESDTPDHCAGCGCFLENPLTPDGVAYVREALERATGNPIVLETWREFYWPEL